MESWMISLCIAIVGVIGTYAVLRNRVSRLESDYKDFERIANSMISVIPSTLSNLMHSN